jgi:hypothetical protein
VYLVQMSVWCNYLVVKWPVGVSVPLHYVLQYVGCTVTCDVLNQSGINIGMTRVEAEQCFSV